MPAMAGGPETLTGERSVATQDLAPHLFLVLNSDRPLEKSVRVSLRGIDQVTLRRATDEFAFHQRAGAGAAGIDLDVVDPWMSTVHATLRRLPGAWSLEDHGSRNGTLLNGRPVQREQLADGDLIEIGHTFFIFRAGLPSAPDKAAVLDSGSLRPPAKGLATLLPGLTASFRQLEAVARSKVPVLIRGESGTGKEITAAALHTMSGLQGPFQPLNCGGLTTPLVQVELFGRRQESPGGPDEDPGLIRAAEGGTLFLDEIGDLPLQAQSLLLRALQDGEVFPVGASRPVRAHVRVVGATSYDLERMTSENRFRTDLLARIAGLTLTLPALRERREDLGLLIGSFLREQAGDGPPASFTPEALRAMLLYPWPLNVRELEKTVQTAAVLAGRRPIALGDLPSVVRDAPPPRQAGVRKPGGTIPDHAGPPAESRLQRFIAEVSRRHVVRVMVAYAVAVFGALQGADIIVTRLSLPPQWMVWLVVASLVGLPLTALLSWVYDWTNKGIVRTAPLSPDHRAPVTVRRRQARRVGLALVILVGVAAGGVVWWRHR